MKMEKKGGFEGRQVNVRGVLGKILSTERLRNELYFFDEQASLLLRLWHYRLEF